MKKASPREAAPRRRKILTRKCFSSPSKKWESEKRKKKKVQKAMARSGHIKFMNERRRRSSYSLDVFLCAREEETFLAFVLLLQISSTIIIYWSFVDCKTRPRGGTGLACTNRLVARLYGVWSGREENLLSSQVEIKLKDGRNPSAAKGAVSSDQPSWAKPADKAAERVSVTHDDVMLDSSESPKAVMNDSRVCSPGHIRQAQLPLINSKKSRARRPHRWTVYRAEKANSTLAV